WLRNAMQAFQILLQIGAGTGLIFLLRWYWWRINAWGEIAAMVLSFLIAAYLHFGHARLGFAPLLAWFLGCLFVYATFFATGYLLYGRLAIGGLCAATAVAAAFGLWRTIPKVGFWTA